MAGQGEQLEVKAPGGETLGTVWESGHFSGMGYEGRVRRTPNGWTISNEGDDIGTIDRDGVSGSLALEGAEVVSDGEVIARVADEQFAPAALALVQAIESEDAADRGHHQAMEIPDIPEAAQPQVATSVKKDGPSMLIFALITLPLVLLAVLLLLYLAV